MEVVVLIHALLIATIAHHVWIHKTLIFPTCAALWAKQYWSPWRWSEGSVDIALQSEIDKLRIKVFSTILMICSHLLFFAVAITLLDHWSELRKDEMRYKHTQTTVHLGIMLFSYYVVCRLVCEHRVPVSSWCIDAVVALVHICMIVRVASMKDDTAYFVLSPTRAMVRLVSAVFYMDTRGTVFWNLILSLLTCRKCHDNIDLLSDVSLVGIVYAVEALVFCGIVFACACTKWVCKVCLTAQLKAEDALAVHHDMLAVLCDAVVKVDAHGKIIAPSPHFCHLISNSKSQLEENYFVDFLATEPDQLAVKVVLNALPNCEARPLALHVSLRRSVGPPLPAQLLFAVLPDRGAKSGCLVGIREMTKVLKEAQFDNPGLSTNLSELRKNSGPEGTCSSVSSASRHALKKIDSACDTLNCLGTLEDRPADCLDEACSSTMGKKQLETLSISSPFSSLAYTNDATSLVVARACTLDQSVQVDMGFDSLASCDFRTGLPTDANIVQTRGDSSALPCQPDNASEVSEARTYAASSAKPPRIPGNSRGQAQRRVVLNTARRVLQQFHRTPDSTMKLVMFDALTKLNVQGKGCCSYHISLLAASRFLKSLAGRSCRPEFFTGATWQCGHCFAVNMDLDNDEDDDSGPECCVCENAEPLVITSVSGSDSPAADYRD